MDANRLKLNAEKTELLWAGSSIALELGSSGLSVQFGGESTSASDHVRVLGVTISSDLSFEKHVANGCSSGFYCYANFDESDDLDTDSMKTLVHAFVMLRVDYCRPCLLYTSPSPRD